MARYRVAPQCPFCDEVIADAVYEELLESQQPFFGDTFSHWKYRDHECEAEEQFRASIAKDLDKIVKTAKMKPLHGKT